VRKPSSSTLLSERPCSLSLLSLFHNFCYIRACCEPSLFGLLYFPTFFLFRLPVRWSVLLSCRFDKRVRVISVLTGLRVPSPITRIPLSRLLHGLLASRAVSLLFIGFGSSVRPGRPGGFPFPTAPDFLCFIVRFFRVPDRPKTMDFAETAGCGPLGSPVPPPDLKAGCFLSCLVAGF